MSFSPFKHLSLIFFISTVLTTSAQVSINPGNNTPLNSTAILDVQSTDKGFVPPRMNAAQRRAISSPTAGLIVFDTDRQTPYFYNGTNWKALTSEISLPNAAIAGIDATDGASGDGFGANVSVYGNYAIASAYRDDIGSNINQGSAYIFKFENGSWVQTQKLIASDGQAYDEFGGGVAMDSNYAFVGAVFADVNGAADQGCMYVFKLENGVWIQKQKIVSVNASAGDWFGQLSYSNGYLAIAASKDDIGANTDQGAAYIYKLDSATGVWTEMQKLTANDGTSGDFFGYWINIDSNKVIITAINDDANGVFRRGSAYIFTLQSGVWAQSARLIANDGVTQDNFGRGASIQGDYAIVGSYFSDVTFTNQGAAYLFKLENGTWTQKQKILASDPGTNSHFGTMVSLRNNFAVVGAQGHNTYQGSAYLFQLNTATNTMTQIQKITAADGVAYDYLGFVASIHNYTVLIGAHGKNSERGRIYFKAIDY